MRAVSGNSIPISTGLAGCPGFGNLCCDDSHLGQMARNRCPREYRSSTVELRRQHAAADNGGSSIPPPGRERRVGQDARPLSALSARLDVSRSHPVTNAGSAPRQSICESNRIHVRARSDPPPPRRLRLMQIGREPIIGRFFGIEQHDCANLSAMTYAVGARLVSGYLKGYRPR